MSTHYRIAQSADLENIYSFAFLSLQKETPDEMECMMKVWSSRFRKEALEHYLKFGWSFVAENQESETIQGFFLAQPILFLEGQTQSLWVELVQAENKQIETELVEIAYKLSKDKHLQRVIFSEETKTLLDEKKIKYQNSPSQWISCKTTK